MTEKPGPRLWPMLSDPVQPTGHIWDWSRSYCTHCGAMSGEEGLAADLRLLGCLITRLEHAPWDALQHQWAKVAAQLEALSGGVT